jgi:hypothetical protein
MATTEFPISSRDNVNANNRLQSNMKSILGTFRSDDAPKFAPGSDFTKSIQDITQQGIWIAKTYGERQKNANEQTHEYFGHTLNVKYTKIDPQTARLEMSHIDQFFFVKIVNSEIDKIEKLSIDNRFINTLNELPTKIQQDKDILQEAEARLRK